MAVAALLILAPVCIAASCKGQGGGRAAAPAGAGEASAAAPREQEKATAAEPGGATDPGTAAAGEEAAMKEKFGLTHEEKKWLMGLAKDAVKAAASGKEFTPPDPPTANLREKGAAFVTLKKGGNLRGCIGHIVARVPLFECVAEVARSAALEDPRFSPVTAAEYGSLHFEISVLTPPQDVKDPAEIVVGTDGVLLSYGFNQGVFLPQVPTEQGWDREEYLDHLCFKAGVMKEKCWKDPKAKLRKFQAIVWEQEDVR